MIEYVKPDATIESVESVKPLPKLDTVINRIDGEKTAEVRILALDKIDEFTVRKAIGGSRANARVLLEQLRAQGKLKTKAERIAELAPKVIEELPLEK